MLTHQPSPSKLIAPCSHHPSPATQRSPYPLLQFRIRFTNSRRLFLHRESRISLAMHVGTPSFLCPPPFLGFITHHLDRQRKVKCNQLPGQLKVRHSPSFPLHVLDQPFLSFPSAKYAIPLRPSTNSLTLPCLALYGQKLSMHVRSPRLYVPPVAESTSVCLDTTPSRLLAKRSASRLSVDDLARTHQTPNRGLCIPSPSCPLPHEAILL